MWIFFILMGGALIFIALNPEIIGRGGYPGVSHNQIALGLTGFLVILGGVAAMTSTVIRQRIQGFIRRCVGFQVVRPAMAILLTAWVGLVTGFVEVLIRVFENFILNNLGARVSLIWNPYVIWMDPLAYFLIFLILGLALGFVAYLWPKFASLRVTAFLTSSVGIYSLFSLSFPWIDLYAILLVTAGIAAQAARLIVAHYLGFYRLVQRTTMWMLVLVCGLGVAQYGLQVLADQTVSRNVSAPTNPSAPNVLLIVLDTVRAQNLSLYEYARSTTKNLEELAKTGIVFNHALSTSPWTLPSHASMFTGRYPHELSTNWTIPLDATYPTLAEVLTANGYRTGGFVANLVYGGYLYGLDRGFLHYEDWPLSLGMLVENAWLTRKISNALRSFFWYRPLFVHKNAEEINQDFLNWLSGEQQPFFAFLNYFDAHAPYLPPFPFEEQFGPKRNFFVKNTWSRDLSQEEIQQLVDAYDGSIAYMDHAIEGLLHNLEKLGLLENTLVIVTSDHGEHFGEHGLMDHANSLYLPLVHVPLLISFPSHLPVGKRVSDPITLRDLPATIIDLIGLDKVANFQGNSLVRFFSEQGKPVGQGSSPLLAEVSAGINMPRWFPNSKYAIKSIVVDGFHYIRIGDDSEELYDFRMDPSENRNLITQYEGTRRLADIRLALTENSSQ